MLLSAIRRKLAMLLLLLCIAISAAAQDPCSNVTTENVVVSGGPLTVDTTLDIAARFTVGQHDSPEIRVKLITRGAEAGLVEVLVTGSKVTIQVKNDATVNWAAATSCPAPLLPLAVAATAWAVTPQKALSRHVSLASSLALVAWTVSRVDAQKADSSDQECTSIEVELEFPRSGSLGYDQVMQNGGITLPDTVRMVGCVPGYVLQKATGLCESSITGFDVYAKPSSKAFNKWAPDARYPEECPTYIHDMFAVLGEDGKVYPTWHPPVYKDLAASYTCNFGHEHGDDPSTSTLYANEPVPFGYVNEQHFAADPLLQRHESHVGHKVQVGNDVKICNGNRKSDCEKSPKHIATCQIVMKIHQGTSGTDAFTNNLHEVFLFARCEQAGPTYLYKGEERDSYGKIDVNIKYLNRFDNAGMVDTISGCPYFGGSKGTFHLQVDLDVLPVTPADSPDGEGARRMLDDTCIDDIILVDSGKRTKRWGWGLEHWIVVMKVASVTDTAYMTTFNAARYYDATSPETKYLKHFVDLCYETGPKQVRGDTWCEQVRQEDDVITWDDPRSPWKGTQRNISPNRLSVNNPGPDTVFYSDAYGQNLVTDPATCGAGRDGVGCVKQYIGVGSGGDGGADILMRDDDWGVPSTHAPN